MSGIQVSATIPSPQIPPRVARKRALWHTARESISMMSFHAFLDVFAFSSLLVAAIGFGLSIVSSLALAAPDPLHWALLTGTGAFIIYNLDRLRDTARDQVTSPLRTAFIERHRNALTYSVAIVAVAFGGLLFTAPSLIVWICVGIGLLGLFHRRIKNAAVPKALYVSVAWSAVCMGLPWVAARQPREGVWLAAMIWLILCGNLVASNLTGNGETEILGGRRSRGLRWAGGLILIALALAFMAPPRLAAVGWIASAEGIALLLFRPSERYDALVIDGALLAGSLVAATRIALLD